MKRNVGIVALIAVIVSGFVVAYALITPEGQLGMGTMDGMEVDAPNVPPVGGYFGGDEIAFIHPEASDPEVAEMLTEMLTEMMDSPVILVPALADVPDEALANVYVFTDGVEPEDEPMGPFEFQADVFDSVPGNDEYSPLRQVLLVSWQEDAEPRILRSVEEVDQADAAGEITIERTDVVVNMPMLTWPEGER